MGLLELTGEARTAANNRLMANVRCECIGLSNICLVGEQEACTEP